MKRVLAMCAMALAACGPVEVRIDETKGVPSVKGQTEVSLSSFTCGQPIAAGDKTVTTKMVTGGCEFTFDDTLEVLKASDYEQIGELKTASNLVQRVELSVKKLDFIDGTSGAKLDLSTRVTSATLSVNGQQVADKAQLASLPVVVTLSGAALAAIKSKVDARQPVSVAVKAVAVLPDTPKPPDKLKIDYEAQPAIIIGPGEVKVF
ncbi:MAG: hypothetical protein ACOZQL_17400 [Myxococcota bacterium]